MIRLYGPAVATLVVLVSAAGRLGADRKPDFEFVYSDDHRRDATGVG